MISSQPGVNTKKISYLKFCKHTIMLGPNLCNLLSRRVSKERGHTQTHTHTSKGTHTLTYVTDSTHSLHTHNL